MRCNGKDYGLAKGRWWVHSDCCWQCFATLPCPCTSTACTNAFITIVRPRSTKFRTTRLTFVFAPTVLSLLHRTLLYLICFCTYKRACRAYLRRLRRVWYVRPCHIHSPCLHSGSALVLHLLCSAPHYSALLCTCFAALSGSTVHGSTSSFEVRATLR